MSYRDIEYRPSIRTPSCRGCDKEVPYGEMLTHTYSLRGRGTHVYLCDSCLTFAYNQMIQWHKEDD